MLGFAVHLVFLNVLCWPHLMEKCNVTVCFHLCVSVCPSVCLSHQRTVTHLGTACDSTGVYFGRTIWRTDILVRVDLLEMYDVYKYI